MVGKQVSARKKSPEAAVSRANPTMTRALPGPGSAMTWPAAFCTRRLNWVIVPPARKRMGGVLPIVPRVVAAGRQAVEHDGDRRDSGAGVDRERAGVVGHEVAFLAGEINHVVGVLVTEQAVRPGE